MATDVELQEASEQALEEAASQVDDATEAMRVIIRDGGDRPWTARELQDLTADVGPWSSSIASLAFWRLVENRELIPDDDLIVRPASAS